METIATPLPWEVKCIGHSIYVEAIDRSALDLPGGGFVCDSQADRTDTPEERAQMKQTMAFIVLACNAHDGLMVALEEISAMSQVWMDGDDPYMGDALTAARYKSVADHAIAKVKPAC